MGKLYYHKHTEVFHNGNFVKAAETKIDLFTQSLHYGNAVFDAMRAYNTPLGPNIFKAKEHYERLISSAFKMGITLRYSIDELINITYQLLDRNNLHDAYIRPLIYYGSDMQLSMSGEPQIFIAAWKWEKYLGKELMDVMVSSYSRPSPRSPLVESKVTGYYVHSILATTEARRKGYDDAILLDIAGNIAEGSGANIFFEKDGILYTPSRGNIIPGITRATVLEICQEMGIEVFQNQIRPEDILQMDGAFFTGTAYQITGIKSINGKALKLHWQDTIGCILHERYGRRVTQSEYYNYAII
jgi:branched-chain amino acid aminotransferase